MPDRVASEVQLGQAGLVVLLEPVAKVAPVAPVAPLERVLRVEWLAPVA